MVRMMIVVNKNQVIQRYVFSLNNLICSFAQCEETEVYVQQDKTGAKMRVAVSAEVYGRFNEKQAFEPKVIAKSGDVKEK